MDAAMPSRTEAAVDEEVRRFDGLPVATIVDAMYQLNMKEGALEPHVKRIAGPRIAGRARTVDRVVIPRNSSQAAMHPTLGLALYDTIDSLRPGEVLVISGGDASYATLGDNQALRCTMRGAVGVVTDTAVRDTQAIDALGFGAYAAGVSVRPGQFRLVTVAVDRPVVCGGVLISPGDIVVGDEDGVVVIPAKDADAVATRAREVEDLERRKHASLREGMPIVEAVKTYNIR